MSEIKPLELTDEQLAKLGAKIIAAKDEEVTVRYSDPYLCEYVISFDSGSPKLGKLRIAVERDWVFYYQYRLRVWYDFRRLLAYNSVSPTVAELYAQLERRYEDARRQYGKAWDNTMGSEVLEEFKRLLEQ